MTAESTRPHVQNDLWLQRARACLAGGVSSHFRAGAKQVFTHGRGSRIWDVDGNEYLDFTLSQGPLIHGHSHPAIVEHVSKALAQGQLYNAVHREEVELAEKLVACIPCADLVRFGSTGSEAVHAVLRLARAFTGREKIVKFEGHYHGWYDNIIASIGPTLDQAGPELEPQAVPWTSGLARGSLDDLIVLPWNDLDRIDQEFQRRGDEIAAVITEPCMCNTGCIEPRSGYLEGLRRLCSEHGTLLIFDEVITGFRLALGGAQEYYSVVPDLAVLGKAVASGFPISVIAGRRDVMEFLGQGRTIQAGTLNANTTSVAACMASLRLLEQDDRAAYKQLRDHGNRLMRGLREAATEAGLPVLLQGPGPVFHMGFTTEPAVHDYRDVVRSFDTERHGRFVAGMLGHGIRLLGRGIWYLSTVHTNDDVDAALTAARQVLAEIAARQ